MERKFYQTTLAQDVVVLQTKYCIDKRVVNILASMSSNTPLDFNILKEASKDATYIMQNINKYSTFVDSIRDIIHNSEKYVDCIWGIV